MVARWLMALNYSWCDVATKTKKRNPKYAPPPRREPTQERANLVLAQAALDSLEKVHGHWVLNEKVAAAEAALEDIITHLDAVISEIEKFG